MIVRPSIDKILRAISRDLEGEVLDAIDDQTVRVTVQMMAQLLDAMARRYANESEFIRDPALSCPWPPKLLIKTHPRCRYRMQ